MAMWVLFQVLLSTSTVRLDMADICRVRDEALRRGIQELNHARKKAKGDAGPHNKVPQTLEAERADETG